MMTKEEMDTFYKLSEKLANEIKRVALKIDEAYSGCQLKNKKKIEVINIFMNRPDKVNYTLFSNWIKDDLDQKYCVDVKELTLPDNEFEQHIDNQLKKMTNEMHNRIVEETKERALLKKLKEKYEPDNNDVITFEISSNI